MADPYIKLTILAENRNSCAANLMWIGSKMPLRLRLRIWKLRWLLNKAKTNVAFQRVHNELEFIDTVIENYLQEQEVGT